MSIARYPRDIEQAVLADRRSTRAWESIECWNCGGFGLVRDADECATCGGSGRVIRYTESGVYAKYQGGPLLGRDARK